MPLSFQNNGRIKILSVAVMGMFVGWIIGSGVDRMDKLWGKKSSIQRVH